MTHLRCPATGETYPADHRHFRGPHGDPLEVVHDQVPAVTRATFDDRLGQADAPYDSGVWRFKELVYPELPLSSVVSRPEGNTPLFRAPSVQRFVGVEQLRLKHEGMNPTGSFKDRGMTVALSQAHHLGAKAVICASTGNTSASMASYAALAEMTSVLLVPEGKTALGKLGQALAFGATTLMIRGDFDDAMHLVQRASQDLGYYLLNSLNPFRVEGQKAILLELLQQYRWDPPDWVILPAGNLGNTAAFGRALREAKAAGLIDRVPRIAAVQAEGASPFAKAFVRGFDELVAEKAETIATAIRIGAPVSYARAVQTIRETNGVVLSVSDAAILEAKAHVDAAGIGAEPASCASVAGARQLVERGLVRPTDRVACILTGHLLKDPNTTLRFHRSELGASPLANPPTVIDATFEAMVSALK